MSEGIHDRFHARRRHVAQLLSAGVEIRGKVREQIAREFGVSSTAIGADIIALRKKTAETIHLQASIRRKVYARDGIMCQYCGRSDRPNLIIEHVIPAAMDGPARLFNLVVACQSCNSRKRRRVWTPRNLDEITESHPEWKNRVLALTEGNPAYGNEDTA